MRALLLALQIVAAAGGPSDAAGICTYYGDGIMEQSYRNNSRRGRVTPCPECVAYVAMADCRWLNQRIWLQPADAQGNWLPPRGWLLVVDCGAAQHRAAQQARQLVGEFDRQTARELGMRGPIACRVVSEDFAQAWQARRQRLTEPHIPS